MAASLDVVALGNAILDVIAPASDAFLQGEGMAKGAMTLIDADRAQTLYGRMAPGMETSGGSAGNTAVGLASLGLRAGFLGKVGADPLGEVYHHDITAAGVAFLSSAPSRDLPTGRSMINVTPDGQRTMSTFLGAANQLAPDDVDPSAIAEAEWVYLEGYLFDPPQARAAFRKAAQAARGAGRRIALSLSDAFVVERHREELLDFIGSDVDLVFANEVEALGLFQTADRDRALDALAGRVAMAAVTLGAEGSVTVQGAQREAVSAAPVAQVVDTTGAGDQYAAGFLAGLVRGRGLGDCARLGALVAAEVISHYGPRPQTPLAALARQAGLG